LILRYFWAEIHFYFLALGQKCDGPRTCACTDCVGHPTFSVGVGPGPGAFDLFSAQKIEPFEETDTFFGIGQWSDLVHLWSEDVPTHLLIHRLCEEAKLVWESTYSNE
jgi:hypothetical protein